MGQEMKKIFFLLLLTTIAFAYPYTADDDEISTALDYLSSQQLDSGAFGNQGTTAWSVVAICSAGADPNTWVKNGNSPIDYLLDTGQTDTLNPPNAYSRTILAATCAGANPSNFNDVDLISHLKNYQAEDGKIGNNLFSTIWGTIALSAAGESDAAELSAQWLLDNENEDGCWGTESNTCSAAIQALKTTGVENSNLADAKTVLKSYQQDDGGFIECETCVGGTTSDANSDSWAIQAILSLEEDPTNEY